MTAYDHQTRLATPWERLAAYSIDILSVVALSLTLLVASGDPSSASALDVIALPALVSFVYFTAFMVTCRATPGKLAYGLRITMRDGSLLEPAMLLLRYVVFFLTLLVPLAPLISGGSIWLRPDRQSIHDRLVRTVVVRTR